MVFLIFTFKESRGSILLSKKAKALNKWYDELEAYGYYGMRMLVKDEAPQTAWDSSEDTSNVEPQRIRWKVKADEERASLAKMVSISLYRPFHLLFTEPVVLFFSLWITFAWSVLYLLFSTIPLIFETRHNFNLGQVGAVFSAISISSILATIVNVYQEPLAYSYLPERWQGFFKTPEGRLMFCCVQSTLLPIGCFWFG